jgi:hypothetical protein
MADLEISPGARPATPSKSTGEDDLQFWKDAQKEVKFPDVPPPPAHTLLGDRPHQLHNIPKPHTAKAGAEGTIKASDLHDTSDRPVK